MQIRYFLFTPLLWKSANKEKFVSLIALDIVRLGTKNSAIKQENSLKSANKQQNSANKHA